MHGCTVFLLNGPSSSGKSTIAAALRTHMGNRSALVSVDDIYNMVSPELDNSWEVFSCMNATLFNCVKSLAFSGFVVIADTVFERSNCLTLCADILEGLDVYLVGVEADLEDLKRREILRKNRSIGLAENQFRRVHSFCDYDVIVNTSTHTPVQCATEIARVVRKGPVALAHADRSVRAKRFQDALDARPSAIQKFVG